MAVGCFLPHLLDASRRALALAADGGRVRLWAYESESAPLDVDLRAALGEPDAAPGGAVQLADESSALS